MNREISEYPVRIVPENDPYYYPVFTGMIFFEIDISEYKYMISRSLGGKFDSHILGITESGEATSNDLLMKIRHRIMQMYRFKICPNNAEKILVLKFSGFSDYLLDSYKLKDYKRINSELGKKVIFIKLLLTEIPPIKKNKNFPPLYKIRNTEEFDFTKLENSSLMYLYPPKKVAEESKNLDDNLQAKYQDKDGKWVSKKLPSFFTPNSTNQKSKFKNSFLVKRKEQFLKSSGMQFPFRFKIIGFEKLWNVFDCLIYWDDEKISQEMDRNNFMLQPQFLKPLKTKEDVQVEDVPAKSLLKRYLENLDTKLGEFWSIYHNFGCNVHLNEVFKVLEFEEKNYVPLNIFLKCHLYLGSELLHKPIYTK